ncbi:cadmium-translocating P-type ATPase [Rhodohalobacter sp. SW132]|uniref:heavy metal translocating P-type ATPase n=1 Tax=Rhodohalobacter sp. SW132 TaxID=2293433 RepID=UPI000E22B47B|nr:heavy metal translocating P-type ATPase [Rhodohalobacter sp. SW132]REL33123.1 cadmium-translocating P-type ATPase [Rhodohalobacter sp. SW132]
MAQNHSHGPSEITLTIVCAVSLSLGAISDYTQLLPDSFSIYFYIISYISGGYYGTKDTLKQLARFKIDIHFLMISAAIGAAVLGQWIEGAILLFLFSLSGALEHYALDKSRTAIHSLLQLRPSQALRINPDESEETVPIEELKIGDKVIVKPGEHIPIDGKIIKGETTVDQSAITGESVPVSKSANDTVFAATLNENGVIELKVTKRPEDTTVSKIIELVEKAQKNRAKTQRFLDSFEPRYAVSIVLFVIGLIFIPWLIFGHEFDPTFYRAMTVLVVASPCALIISTPASIISAIANGAKKGVLFKGGAYVEQTVEIDTIAFDKTGTLTEGKPAVTDLWAWNDIDSNLSNRPSDTQTMLAIAAGCEIHSEHHLASAIVDKAAEMEIVPQKTEQMQAVPGKGVTAQLEGSFVSVGNLKMYEDVIPKWDSQFRSKAETLRNEGKTVVFVVRDDSPIGLIALADQLRPAAAQTIKELRELGIKKMVMLTGDNRGVAESIGAQLGLDEIHADLLPEQKVDVIEKLKAVGTVAMIGDGVNDAPALAISHLGIAMGAAGTDVALETADIVLMGDDLTKLPYLISLSRKSKKVVWQNILFSMAIILMLLLGVFLIDLPLTLGVIGHEGSTLLVVLNGLRLLWN